VAAPYTGPDWAATFPAGSSTDQRKLKARSHEKDAVSIPAAGTFGGYVILGE
jgi:hypothetical protein